MVKPRHKKRTKKSRLQQRASTQSEHHPGGSNWPFDVVNPEFGTKNILTTEFFVAARPRNCYGLITAQLEQAPPWDPMIVEAKPLSQRRAETDATSKLMFDLGGRTYSTLALICLHDTDRRLAWVSNDEVNLTEEWRLRRKPEGTMVSFALQYEFTGPLGWLRKKLVRRRKVERAVEEMASRFKLAAEGGDA
jgi:ribosome-associated toxin RatA of RatAB toxin-antitoxin module